MNESIKTEYTPEEQKQISEYIRRLHSPILTSPERNKDIRLMLDMISKDLSRLSDDVKCLSQFLDPKLKEME